MASLADLDRMYARAERDLGQKEVKDAVLGDLCPKALLEVARVCGFGRKKYSRLNYMKGFPWSSSYDALQRHLLAFWDGENKDSESGLFHLAHAAWHCLCLLCYQIRGLGEDDRPRTPRIEELENSAVH